MVSGLKATDKMPMYEMPLAFVFGVLGSIFLYWGFWVLAFCPKITIYNILIRIKEVPLRIIMELQFATSPLCN